MFKLFMLNKAVTRFLVSTFTYKKKVKEKKKRNVLKIVKTL